MLTQDRPISQVRTSKVWHQPDAIALTQKADALNPSRVITLEDEAYLRDYKIAAAVISWDEGTYGSLDQVSAADITNIAMSGDIVWYQIRFHRAIPIHIEIFHAHRLQIQQRSSQQEQEETKQPVGYAGDAVACQLRPSTEASVEYSSGSAHGKLDAASGMQPICTEATCPYSAGYLDGYNGILASKQQPQPNKSIGWSVVRDPKWDFYQVWIGSSCLREKATSYEEGEKIARKYIALEELRQKHRELVLAAFAC